MDFELSPTYPRRFIMPISFLGPTPLRPSTSARPPADVTLSYHLNRPPAPTPPPPPPPPPRTSTNNFRQSMPAPPPPMRDPITGELPPGPYCYYDGMERLLRPVVPGTSSPEARKDRLQKLVSFRSNARFPMISWKSPRSGLMLMRCSQPMVGILGARYGSLSS